LCFLTVDTSPVYGGDLEHTAAVLSWPQIVVVIPLTGHL
jgi:hypothetical protein